MVAAEREPETTPISLKQCVVRVQSGASKCQCLPTQTSEYNGNAKFNCNGFRLERSQCHPNL